MSTNDRRAAIQGKTDLEASRLAYAVEHMASNKAYRYAAMAAGGDQIGRAHV